MIEQKVFDIIERISKDHSHKVFGYLTEDDLRNEIWVIALSKLKDYDYTQGKLENWMRRVVKNRLINRFKDMTKSVKCPCHKCPEYLKGKLPDCRMFGENKMECDKWQNYSLSVESRNSLLNASEESVERRNESVSLKKVMSDEVRGYLESRIEEKFKRDFKELISGGKLSKQKLKKLKMEIQRILLEQEGLFQLKVGGKNASNTKG